MANKKNAKVDPLKVDEALATSETFLLKYKNIFLGAVAAVVIIVCAVLGYKNFISEPRELKAQEAIFKGQQYFSNDQFELALNGDSLGYTGFIAVADKYGSTDAGNLANAYIGLCYAQLGEFDLAVKYLDKFKSSDYFISPALLATMGNCYAQLGQLDKAAATLMKAANQADSQSISPAYLIQAGQILEKLGKNAEAVEAYKTVKTKYSNSYQAMEIDKYIERASAK